MRVVDVGAIKLIQELRLRKWARDHYVVPEQRGKSWHPIVLQEMEFRDAELAETELPPVLHCSPFVPLAPTETYYLDEPHAAVPAPKSLMSPSDREPESRYVY